MSGFAGLQFDEATVRRAQRGDRRALDVVCRTLAPAVFTLCFRLCQSRAAADDLTQETFVEMMRYLPRYRGDASLATWVRSIAVSRSLMHLRSAWQRKATAMDALDQALPAAKDDPQRRVELCSDIGQALALLPPLMRAVVWLYDVEGYSHKEIARLMGKTVSFSKSSLCRAHQRLRELLSADGAIAAAEAVMPSADNADRSPDQTMHHTERCLA